MATIVQIELELSNNYVNYTTTFEEPEEPGEPKPKSYQIKQHWSLKDSYFDGLYLNTIKPEEVTGIEIINTITGNRIYITTELLDQDKVYLTGEPIGLDGLVNFLSKYTAYVELPETGGLLK